MFVAHLDTRPPARRPSPWGRRIAENAGGHMGTVSHPRGAAGLAAAALGAALALPSAVPPHAEPAPAPAADGLSPLPGPRPPTRPAPRLARGGARLRVAA